MNNKFVKRICTVFIVGQILIGLSGCDNSQQIQYESKEITNVSFDAVFHNAMETILMHRWKITHTEKESGIIVARPPGNLFISSENVTVLISKTTDSNRIKLKFYSNDESCKKMFIEMFKICSHLNPEFQ